MITLKQYNNFCSKLPAATHVIQWRGAHVWKVGGKVFTLAVPQEGQAPAITFKCGEIAYEMLREQPGLRPAPYLASRGFKWIQHYEEPGLDRAELNSFLKESHRLVAAKLTRKLQKELALEEWIRSEG